MGNWYFDRSLFCKSSASVELLWIIAITASYILANYYIYIKKRNIPEIFFTGFLLLVISIQVFSMF